MDIRTAFGRHLRQLRLTRRLSQEELAFRAQIDRTYMSSIERGEANPTLVVLDRLAHALRVPLTELVELDRTHRPVPANLRRGRRLR
jgi:transcriptional regulator with XRE-family HTH domain